MTAAPRPSKSPTPAALPLRALLLLPAVHPLPNRALLLRSSFTKGDFDLSSLGSAVAPPPYTLPAVIPVPLYASRQWVIIQAGDAKVAAASKPRKTVAGSGRQALEGRST